jgi:hypothetical protein
MMQVTRAAFQANVSLNSQATDPKSHTPVESFLQEIQRFRYLQIPMVDTKPYAAASIRKSPGPTCAPARRSRARRAVELNLKVPMRDERNKKQESLEVKGSKNVPGVFSRFGAVVLGDFYKTISVSDTQRNPM